MRFCCADKVVTREPERQGEGSPTYLSRRDSNNCRLDGARTDIERQ
jgi:hypothetical protein